MKPLLAACIIVLTCLLLSTQANAQLRADFVMDKSGGCSPLVVQFTNTTQGASPNAKWQWNFNNGNTSSLKDPSAVFTNATTFNITLTVTDGTQTSTQTKAITVYKKPVIDFSIIPANGCTPLNTMLTGSMTGGDGTIGTWNWDFGDGSVEQTNTPVVNHLYNFKQTASVSLTAINNFGCASTILKNNIVTVKDSVKASFTVNQRTFCEHSANVSFTNTSTGAGLLTYLWDFGDGGSSTAASPTHTYNTRGIYTVRLTVSSSEGCTVSKVETNYINVGSFVSDFAVPAINCENRPILFKNTSSPDPTQSNWFVNGLPVTATSDTALEYYFPSAGLYTVRLVNDFDICQQEVTKQVEIRRNPKIDSFIVDHGVFCSSAPYRVNFRDTSSDAVAWRWYFSSWIDIGANTPNLGYDYYSNGNHPVRLEIDNAEGCTSSITQYVNIKSHNIYIPIHPYNDQACDSFTKVVQAISNYPVTNYLWDFQDGTTSTEATPTHTFKGRGEKYVTLTYTTEGGCTGTITGQTALVLESPKADFTIDSVICGDDWLPLSINWISGDAYIYKFDMGIGQGYEYLYSDFHYTEEGVYTISMIAGNTFCWDTVTKQNVVRVKGPWVRIQDVIYTCEGDRNTIIFKDSSTTCDKWSWDFGDGATQTYNTYRPSLTHTYANSVNYEVKLKGERDGCTIEKTVEVYILKKQKPVLTLDQPVCINEPAQFHIRGLEPNIYILSNPMPRYEYKKWEYRDGSPFNGGWSNDSWAWFMDLDGKLTVNGIKDDSIRMIMTSYFHNCEDTTNYVPIVVKGVNTNFEVVSDSTCFKSPVILRDNSTAIGSNNITSWRWDFGDGRQLTTTQGGLVNHRYDSPGQYIVRLSASDAGGCTNSITNASRPVTVLGVKASFSVSPSTTVAPLNPLQFNNTSYTAFAGTVTWQWDFGDGNSSSAMNPVHVYASQGTYTARLIAIDNFSNCRDTATILINCGPEVTNFTINTAFIGDQSVCPPVKAAFAYTSNLPADSIVWNFGDGFILEDQTHPSHIYTMAGQYIVTLHVYFQSVLIGTHSDTVHVLSPPAAIACDDLSGCIGDRMTLYSPQQDSGYNYTWDFGNGFVTGSADSVSWHTYSLFGTFSPVLIVRNADGCASSVKLSDNIVIHPDPQINITPAAAIACKENGVQLQASGGVNFAWSPAAGLNNPALANPIATPAINTVYSVHAIDANGCDGSATVNVVVAQPFNMQATSAADICAGEKVRLNVSGAASYQWINNIAGLDNTGIGNPMAGPGATTTYTVVGYDQYQCYSDTVEVVVNVRPSPAVRLGDDIQVSTGMPQILQSTGSADIVRWQWTPANYLSCSDCAAPVTTPQGSIEYILKVYNQYNCVAADTIKITAICQDNVGIPNAFTPNNDGHNDVFGIPGQGVGKVIFLRVYNRWGEIVFERKDFIPTNGNGSWDGKYKGFDAPEGVYVYIAEFECSAGVRLRQKGTVVLIR